MEAIYTRRSIRKFKERLVEPQLVKKLLQGAMQAPSAGNQQPWEFIVVDERKTLMKLKEVSPYAAAIGSAPVSIVFLGNKDKMKYPENWEQDLSAAVENLLLQGVSEGLGTVWLGVAPLEDRMNFVRKVFNLPENILPFAIVPVGYPEGGQENKFIERFDENRIHYNKY